MALTTNDRQRFARAASTLLAQRERIETLPNKQSATEDDQRVARAIMTEMGSILARHPDIQALRFRGHLFTRILYNREVLIAVISEAKVQDVGD